MELGLSLGLRWREEEEEEKEEMQLSLQPYVPRCQNSSRRPDVNLIPASLSKPEDMITRALSGSPNSAVSSFNVDFSAAAAGGGGDAERTLSRESEEEENGNSRKKLRLSKEQSAFLEESFKEHNTLNPKQKIALAKQLNLRRRQVEVWFQNRRARTKLKQTEVDCEYLKRCCETLTEENRRLQKELSELRALKAPSHPFYMKLPATTLSMCPSCEKTTTTTTTTTTTSNGTVTENANSNTKTNTNMNTGIGHQNKSKASASSTSSSSFGSLFAAAAASKPRFYPFAPHPATSPAS